jgi:hypothetical protein
MVLLLPPIHGGDGGVGRDQARRRKYGRTEFLRSGFRPDLQKIEKPDRFGDPCQILESKCRSREPG